MRTVLLTITDDEAGDHPISLAAVDGGDLRPLAECVLPADLLAGKAPEQLRGEKSVADLMRTFVRDTPQSAKFDVIGQHLSTMLFAGEVGECWEREIDAAEAGLRTLLHVRSEELRSLPWEMMRRSEYTMFVDAPNTFTRVTDYPAPRPDPVLLPLKVLVVEGQRSAELGTRQEVRAIKRALFESAGRVEFDFLSEPSWDVLCATYQAMQPHVFHFIGHAERLRGRAALAMRDAATRRPWSLTSGLIADHLRPAPRLAVLNACRSAAAETSSEEGKKNAPTQDVRALTDVFLRRGALAVVGMHGDIVGDAASTFGGALYRAVAGEHEIDEAVTLARRAVQSTEDDRRDWFLPVLTCRAAPSTVLATSCMLSAADAGGVTQKLAPQVSDFVDRAVERRLFARDIDPDPHPRAQPRRLQVVTGDSRAGKTKLVHWMRRRCALRGRRVRYVDLGGKGTLDAAGVLWAIGQTDEDVPNLVGPMAKGAFARFGHDLSYVIDGSLPIEPVESNGGGLRPGPAQSGKSLTPGPQNALETMFKSFRDALVFATSESPLVLILDGLDGVLPDAFKLHLYPELVLKVLDGVIPALTLVVVVAEDQKGKHWPIDQVNDTDWIRVDNPDPEQFQILVEDFLVALGHEIGPAREEKISGLTRSGKWPISDLAKIADVLAMN
ncbi:CHAT domain-containing protein [Alloactinosynnema sp. L-07]|uniref:CHAT domain-containing protein n=1 Tax=Alloactinosynnema sp. L-07 TaxID=1653480 RepID=UPI0006B4EE8C|nr:CHAT domain-containing protein [Alloactinosynnema sp. L-07]